MGSFMPDYIVRPVLVEYVVRALASPLLTLGGASVMTEQEARTAVEKLTTEQLQKLVLDMTETDDE